MAWWNSRDSPFSKDPFGDDSDFFPPRFRIGFQRPSELTWGTTSTPTNNKIQIASLDVKSYKPEEISIKYEDDQLVVRGDHHSEGDEGYETCKFEKKYSLPEGVEPHSVTSRVTVEGRLYLEAPKPRVTEQQIVTTRPRALTDQGGEVSEDENQFKISLDVSDFQPEEISCKLVDRELTITAKHESGGEGRFTARSFTRHFTLPEGASLDSLRSTMNDKGMLIVEADKTTSTGAPKVRTLSIERETSK